MHLVNVRFWMNSGHQRAPIRCLLLTQSRHSVSSSGLLIHPGTQVATSHRINLPLIDAPKEEGE
jgi:hypothetical protein